MEIKITGAAPRIVPDEMDMVIARKREGAFNAITTPRGGDFVIMPDGTLERFSHIFGGTALQTSAAGSWYLGSGGYVEFSGGCNPPIPLKLIVFTGDTRQGQFWFSHHNRHEAHSAVYVSMECRVYQVQKEETEQYDPLPHPLEDADGSDIRRPRT